MRTSSNVEKKVVGAPELFLHQKEAIKKLSSGSILCAGVGTGKSITALAYFFTEECGSIMGGDNLMSLPKRKIDLYIITTARKRDTDEWLNECNRFEVLQDPEFRIIVDSWNNLHKYEKVTESFFIFDEQRVVGSGSWVKSFLRITKKNHWILLSATPGDTWMDYIPVFIANGFYKNRSEFLSLHAVYNRYAKYPKVDRFVSTGRLEAFRQKITVLMEFKKQTEHRTITIPVTYDKNLLKLVTLDRWNPYKEEPIKDISELCYLMRKVVNSDNSRLYAVKELMKRHSKMIVFYNHDHELEALRTLAEKIKVAEWNGHKHEPVPWSDNWVYLVQYMAGAEGWNCIETDTIVFYSQNYSYKLMTQAAGRIDRINTPYKVLYYYSLQSAAPIDQAIAKALSEKKNFNEETFIQK